MKIRGYLSGILATTLALVAMAIFSRLVWRVWELGMSYLEALGLPMPQTEYLLGLLMFLIAIKFGLVALKQFRRS